MQTATTPVKSFHLMRIINRKREREKEYSSIGCFDQGKYCASRERKKGKSRPAKCMASSLNEKFAIIRANIYRFRIDAKRNDFLGSWSDFTSHDWTSQHRYTSSSWVNSHEEREREREKKKKNDRSSIIFSLLRNRITILKIKERKELPLVIFLLPELTFRHITTTTYSRPW